MSFNAKDASPADIELINEMEARAQQEKIDAEQLDAYFAEELASLDDENQAFDEELARLAATERLAALRSDEFRLATQQAEKAAKAVEAAEAARQIAARQLAEKKKPIKPQKQPSKKQPSKKKDPSPSSVIEGLGLEALGLTEEELAMLESPDEPLDEGNEASTISFDDWINEYSDDYPAKAKLSRLFAGQGWNVVNPRGDGFCGLYVAVIDFQTNYADHHDPELIMRVLTAQRSDFVGLIIDGMKGFYKARNQHRELGIAIPDELGDGKLINIDSTNPDSWFHLTEDLLLNHEDTIRANLRVLERLANTPEALFVFLPYIYKRNYLILAYDQHSSDPYISFVMPCYADVVINRRGNVIYPHNDTRNTAIMFNNAHYFLLYNEDNTIKSSLVTRILENTKNNLRPRLWQNKPAMAGIIRTHKGRTHKGRTHKGRTHKGRTHKGRTHKGRTHKGRTKKPKTHIKKTIKYLAK